MVASAATSPLDFAPGGTLAEAILIDLSSPDASLSSVAAKHHIPTATLSLWLTKPETQTLLHAIESGGYAHTRLAAALNLSASIPVLLQILTDFRTLSKSTTDLTEPAYQRASVSARKAAWMLLRLARSHPLTPAQLSAARDTIGVTRTATPRANPIAANQIADVASQPNASEWHRNVDAEQREECTSPPTSTTPTSTTTAATIARTDSPQPTPAERTCPERVPAPAQPARPETPTSITAEPQPPTPSTSSSTPPDDLAGLVAHLASIAEALGIDISELDNLDDLNQISDLAATVPRDTTGPP